MNRLREYMEAMASRQPEGMVTSADGRTWRIAVDGDEATAVIGGDDGELVCYATVGSYANVSEKDLLLEDALKANCFWDETNGSTLSVDPESGELVLADRREPDFVDDDSGLEAFFTQFVATLHSWKNYIANCSPDGVPSGENGAETEPAAQDVGLDGEFGQVRRIYP